MSIPANTTATILAASAMVMGLRVHICFRLTKSQGTSYHICRCIFPQDGSDAGDERPVHEGIGQ